MRLILCVRAANEVPGSAVLVFNIELMDMEEGLPEGYMFIWNSDVSPDLFSEMDKDENKLVEASEVGVRPSRVAPQLPPHLPRLIISSSPPPFSRSSLLPQFTDYIMRQVNEGKGRLAPGFDPYRIIDNMFSNQDRDGDGKITEREFKLKADESTHDEL